MSLEVIELMIKESLRDGEISSSEQETILQQGELMGISKDTVLSLINAEISKHHERITNERTSLEKKAADDKAKEIQRKRDLWDQIFRELVIKWIRNSPNRVLNRKDYMADIREEADKMKIDYEWLDSWIKEVEKKEQEIAGIKPTLFGKLREKFNF